MNASILTVVLAGSMLAGHNAPAWQTDYNQAMQMATAQKKPLAVVFGAGPNGWAKVVRDGAPMTQVSDLLADNYVCVYIDTTSAAGQKLAQQCEITGVGIVISDRTGTTQAFWHQGDLTNSVMISCLERYSNPQVMVRGTETANSVRTSFYPPNAETESMYGSPFGSSYCPSCGNARRR